MKTPKFLLCENPLTGGHDGRLFILHTQDPQLLANVKHFENLTDEERMGRQFKSPAIGRLDYPPETIFFAAVWIVRGADFAALSAQQQADKLAGIMRRMADWYRAYLVWQDSQPEIK